MYGADHTYAEDHPIISVLWLLAVQNAAMVMAYYVADETYNLLNGKVNKL